MPKQWILTTLYIIFIYAVIHGLIIYARTHPIVDEPAAAVTKEPAAPTPETVLDSAPKGQ